MPEYELDPEDVKYNGCDLIDRAMERYNPSMVMGLFSGGDDSLTACHVASKHPNFSGCLHINTGIGIPETGEFVRDTCKTRGWDLKEYRAVDQGQDYDEWVKTHGFPGPYMHRQMYNRLKERSLKKFIAEHKSHYNDRIMLISGCRSDESTRRMGTVNPIQRDPRNTPSHIWVAVIHDWSKKNCLDYLEENNVEQNPVVKNIGKSGECLCGAFAKKGELEHLVKHYPSIVDRIEDLERQVRDTFPWGWEDPGPPKWFTEKQNGQCFMFDMTEAPGPMCSSCHKGKL